MGDFELPPEMLNKMCGVCREPLNVFAPEDALHLRRYVHGRGGVDHEPVPVPLDAATVIMLCDFCKSPHDPPAWTHQTRQATQSQRAHDIVAKGRERLRRFARDWAAVEQPGRIDGQTIHNYNESWAACDPCSTLIMRGEISRLVTRSREVARQFLIDPRRHRVATRRELLDQWDGFLRTALPGRTPLGANGQTTTGGDQ